MTASKPIETDRLILRNWWDDDIQPFAALNQDPEVMAYFPAPYTYDQTAGFVSVIRKMIGERGWGFWAVEWKRSGDFVGMVGLNEVPFDVPISQTLEVGWRLQRNYWGRGVATEAAVASLRYAFDELDAPEVAAFTAVTNQRSRRVMERLGMIEQPDGFDHVRVPEGNPLRPHVLYVIQPTQFRSQWD